MSERIGCVNVCVFKRAPAKHSFEVGWMIAVPCAVRWQDGRQNPV